MIIQLQTTGLPSRRAEPVSGFLGQVNSKSFSEVISSLPSALPSREAGPMSGFALYWLYPCLLRSAWHRAGTWSTHWGRREEKENTLDYFPRAVLLQVQPTLLKANGGDESHTFSTLGHSRLAEKATPEEAEAWLLESHPFHVQFSSDSSRVLLPRW